MLVRMIPLGRLRTIHGVVVLFVIAAVLYTVSLTGGRRIHAETEGRTAPWREWDKKKTPDNGAGYLRDLVRRHGLTPDVAFFSRRIQPKYGKGSSASAADAGRKPPPSMTDAAARLVPRFGGFMHPQLDDTDLELPLDKSPVSLSLERSPTPDAVDGSTLLFGIATTYARVSYRDFATLQDWQRWLTDGKGKGNGASLVLVLQGASSGEQITVEDRLRKFGVDAAVSVATAPQEGEAPSVGARYAKLLALVNKRNEELLQRGDDQSEDKKEVGSEEKKEAGANEERKKIGQRSEQQRRKRVVALVDDDIFFPSMGWLTRRLSQFPIDGDWYVGAPSDRTGDWATLENGRAMTYGGGAVFLSPNVAEEASRLPCMAAESAKGGGSSDEVFWDELLYRCIEEHTKHRLHVLPSLYAPPVTEEEDGGLYSEQMTQKIFIDEMGFGSGQQALALHHYRNYHQVDAGKGHEVASACGEACFLQRFSFSDGWVLVNGVSLSQYPDGMSVVPLRKQEVTAEGAAPPPKKVPVPLADERLVMDHASEGGDGRPDPLEAKVVAWRGPRRIWRLIDSVVVPETGEVWQVYLKKKGAMPDPFASKGDAPKKDGIHDDDVPEPQDSVVLLIWEPSS